MFKRVNNWHLSTLVAIVSIVSLALVQQYASAQWTDPDTLPGGTPSNNLVVNPMVEDLSMGGNDIADTNLRLDGDGDNVIQVTNSKNICLNGDCISTWPSGGAASSVWTDHTDGIWYDGYVGIGGVPHSGYSLTLEGSSSSRLLKLRHGLIWNISGDLLIDASEDIHFNDNVGIGTAEPGVALEIFSDTAGDSNLKLRNSAGDMAIIFQEYDTPDTGDFSIMYNGDNSINNGYSNWLEFWGRNFGTAGARPIMTLQRDYDATPPTDVYQSVGIGVASEELIDAKLRVQGGSLGEDIFQLSNNDGDKKFVVNGDGEVGINSVPHSGYKLFIDADGNPGGYGLKVNDELIWAYGQDLELKATNEVFSGNWFGLGTSAPQANLHIEAADGRAIIESESGDNAELQIQTQANPYWALYQDNATADLRFWNGDNRVVFTDDGNVAIGTSLPAFKLHVYDDNSDNIAVFGQSDDSVGGAAVLGLNTDGSGGTRAIGALGISGPSTVTGEDVTAGVFGMADSAGSAGVMGVQGNGDYAAYFDGHVVLKHTSGGPYNYMQIDHLSGGVSVPASDCDESSEKGRMIYDYTNHRLYVCDDGAWMYTTLTSGK